MISDIDLNPASGQEDIVNIFICYKLNSIPTHYWVNGIMGHDDGGYNKFIGLVPGNLIVSGTVNNVINIGANNVHGHQPYASFKPKANPSDLNKWICLSVHWNIVSEPSYVFCNGQKLCEFQSRQ